MSGENCTPKRASSNRAQHIELASGIFAPNNEEASDSVRPESTAKPYRGQENARKACARSSKVVTDVIVQFCMVRRWIIAAQCVFQYIPRTSVEALKYVQDNAKSACAWLCSLMTLWSAASPVFRLWPVWHYSGYFSYSAHLSRMWCTWSISYYKFSLSLSLSLSFPPSLYLFSAPPTFRMLSVLHYRGYFSHPAYFIKSIRIWLDIFRVCGVSLSKRYV